MMYNSRALFIWRSLFVIVLMLSLLAPLLAPYDPVEVNLPSVFTPPDSTYLLGTDHMGRDIFSRLLYGGRVSLTVALLSVLLSTFVGTVYGGISGYFGGWLDQIMMRLLDALLAIPTLVIILALQAFVQGGLLSLILIIGLTGWMPVARIIRSQILELKEQTFVKAAQLVGTPAWKIFIVHLLRNSLSALFVITIFQCASAIFTEVSLSFLGIGIPPEMPSWGNMLNNAQNDILLGAWWTALFPGMMIILTLLSINFIGESLKRKFGYKGG
ncbi:ABC transporter permease [Paenibacillus sp. J2TS4]|uniref:ABC transporter permease n=1 Tax=Paenibacillus sp. J2TS4 TaxID=2807194 RepID=UPI001B0CE50A|nr:ABC transporter permease [Paenibacillus sp. J2TS4]GIP36440.1 peptide ABC transporter permease [Paenibacillus sp. J2TS4]